MKKLCLALLLAISFLSVPVTTQANQPPPAKTLAERVDLAGLVMVGTAKKVRVVEVKDGKFVRIKPEPTQLPGNGGTAEIEIEVDEVLYPSGWTRKKTVYFLFGGGWFNVAQIRADVIGKKRVYLMKSLKNERYPDLKSVKNIDNMFIPSYPWRLCEPVERRAEIEAALAEANKREAQGVSDKSAYLYGTLMMVGFPDPPQPSTKREPLENMELIVRRQRDKVEVARIKTGKGGQFKIDVVPGEYIVEPVVPYLDPTGKNKFFANSAMVMVWRGGYSQVEPYYDGGH